MSATDRSSSSPGGSEGVLPWVIVSVVVLVGGTGYAAGHLGARLAGDPAPPSNPVDLLFDLASGDVPWSVWSTGVAVAMVVLLAVLMLLVVRVRAAAHGRGRRATRVDPASRHMGRGRDIESLSRKATTATATRLGVGKDHPGLPLGVTLAGRQPAYSDWESVLVDIWGPRTGKTTSMAIPCVLDAPGAVLATSNKRDVVDATRDLRARRGRVWVFDPQALIGEDPTWWWNPLSYVTDEVKAANLAEHFASGSRADAAKTDAYFDPAGQDLLAGLLLAAACADRPVTEVYTWLTRPTEDEPVALLREAGYSLTADQVDGVINLPDKQRGGVYGTAQQMARCLTNRQVGTWVTSRPGLDTRRHFDPADFVKGSTDTLYSLSKEGRGTAGPLVTALTAAVVEAAEEYAKVQPGGRLAVPLVAVLDEAANVCRWAELPNLYSHYGSRGIVLRTILQSWSQGVAVWGETGMKKLWSAANVKTYGGGVDEVDFLQHLSAVIGDHDRITQSVSTGRGQRSVTRQTQRERIMDVSDLHALPKGRAVVLSSGSRPTLIRTVPWMRGPHAEQVKASIAAHDPAAATTLHEAYTELETVEADVAASQGQAGR